MNGLHDVQAEDLQPADSERWLLEFSYWHSIRPALLRPKCQKHPRESSPASVQQPAPCRCQEPAVENFSNALLEYFGSLVLKHFEDALHQGLQPKRRAKESEGDYAARKSIIRRMLEGIERPKTWQEAWPPFWDFFPKSRPEGTTRLEALFIKSEIWPFVDDEEMGAVEALITAWQSGKQSAEATYAALLTQGFCARQIVMRLIANARVHFREMAREWMQSLGLSFQIHLGKDMHSLQEAASAGGQDGEVSTYEDKVRDEYTADASVSSGLEELMAEVRQLPAELFADMSLKERAIVSLRIFGVPIYKPPVSDCPQIDPPRGRDALYQHTFQPFVDQIRQKAEQICSNPVVLAGASARGEDAVGTQLVAGIIDREVRTLICAWLGHPEAESRTSSEKCPLWLLDLLDSTKPHWKTLSSQSTLDL